MVPRASIEGWAEAIAACVTRPEPKRTAIALRKARTHDWSRVLDQMSRRYGRLLRRAPPPERVVAARTVGAP
jgi:hypothetical protein